jgi:type IV pilus assembly protein PilC
MSRFARFLGMMVHADVPIVESLNVVRSATGNTVIAEAVGKMARQVQEGDSLAELMRSAGVFPALPVQMVAVGEETGRLDHMLLQVAEAYEREATSLTKMMTSLLAPALILLVAVVVAFIIVSLVLPIFKLSAGIA